MEALLFATTSVVSAEQQPAAALLRASSCQQSQHTHCSLLYFPRPGGKSFSSFCAPLLSRSWFFSCFLLGSIACWAAPIQTSFLTAGSYMPTRIVPM